MGRTPCYRGNQGPTQVGVGVNFPLELDNLQSFITCANEIKCFRILLLANLSTYCKYSGMNLHVNFKEHYKWANK